MTGAHWDKEIGAVTEVLYRQKVEKSPMLVFDDIPGYARGYRCLYGMFGSPLRLAARLPLRGDQLVEPADLPLNRFEAVPVQLERVTVQAFPGPRHRCPDAVQAVQ